MTKSEAIDAMKRGEKVTHRFFTPDEWMTIDNNEILLEDGVKCSIEEFFHFRKDQYWYDGWSLYLK